MTTSWDSPDDASSILIKPATAADILAITAIYAHHVRHGVATFEEVPPTKDEMERRFEDIRGGSLPYLAAVLDGEIAGFAYASFYRTRSAYRFTVEDSVYLKDSATGLGIGKLLLARLIEEAEALRYRQMIAVIGDRAHRPSIRLHEALGFSYVGVLSSVGFKHDRWVDTVLMQRALGGGGTMPAREIS
jgi:L-amino acid N-acyltransferase YncA